MLIPPYFFPDEKSPYIMIRIPYSTKNEDDATRFLEKLKVFTQYKYEFAITWETKKVRQLFSLKEVKSYPACKIYEGTCNQCGVKYIGETERNVRTRWNEHQISTNKSEPARHIRNNIDHDFSWKILCNAPSKTRERKNLEASFIALLKPSLNEQVDFKVLTLFRNGVT